MCETELFNLFIGVIIISFCSFGIIVYIIYEHRLEYKKTFKIDNRMNNVNSIYEEILELNTPCILQYDDYSMDLNISIPIDTPEIYIPSILRLYMLINIFDPVLPNDDNKMVFTLKHDMSNYNQILQVLNSDIMNNIYMIKFEKAGEDYMNYRVVIGKESAIAVIKLKKELYELDKSI